jgi:hypothetical protein
MKVVEGSEIYNFLIHHFVHFYSKFLSKTWSNTARPTQEMHQRSLALATTRRRALAAPAPGLVRLGIRALCAPSQRCTPSQIPRPARADLVELRVVYTKYPDG